MSNGARTNGARTIVITGATRGLGRALTERFIEAGHTVRGCGRAPDGVEALRNTFGPPHRFEAVDVVDDGRVAEWAENILAETGPPDLLINNAALINETAPLWEVPADQFSRVVDVNIKGVANVIRHFLPAMIARGSGVVVNLSSGWGRSASAEVAPYCATKFAIEGLTRALADELPEGLAAIPLNPGVIHTDMLRIAFGESASSYPKADEWSVKAAPYLLSLGPEHNGQSLTVPA